MSLNRISFLEGWDWEHTPTFLRTRDSASVHSETDSYVSLPETASQISSSFPSTYSKLNFNPSAGPGNETADDHDDRPSLLGLGRGLGSVALSRVTSSGGGAAVALLSDTTYTRGAFEVSPAKRIAQVCVAVVYCFLAAGVVFGFAALKPILIRENAYRGFCSKEELDRDVSVCDGQEIRLNLMFTIAAVATNVSALPVGTILDAYGPRVCGITGSLCLAIGAVLLAFAQRLTFDGYIPGYLFLSLGGPFIFISSFHLSNTFPRHSALILSTLTGAFDASSALFLFLRLLNERTQGYISIQKFSLVYLFVPAFIVLVQLTLMPATSYKTMGELVQYAEAQVKEEMADNIDDTTGDGERERHDRRVHRQNILREIHNLLNDRTSPIPSTSTIGIDDSTFTTHEPNPSHDPTTPPEAPTPKDEIHGILHNRPARHQLLTPWFTLLALFTALTSLRINYFISTIHTQYAHLLPTQASVLSQTFTILLPLSALSAPLTGFILNLRTRISLLLLASLATLLGVLGCIPHNVPAAYTNIVLFVVYRPFFYAAISEYAARVFGFATFGPVYGLLICVAGVGNFAQIGLDALTLKRFGGDPVPVNVGLTGLGAVLGGGLVGLGWWWSLGCPGERGGNIDSGSGSGSGSVGPRGEGAVVVRDWERRPLLRDEEGGGYGTRDVLPGYDS